MALVGPTLVLTRAARRHELTGTRRRAQHKLGCIRAKPSLGV